MRVNARGVEVILPSDLTLETAKQINESGLRLDGIELIEQNGTVVFTDEAVSAFKETLGYECKYLPLDETEEWAKELQAKYEMAKHT